MLNITSNAILDVVIGLAFFYFLLSIVCSAVNEGIATVLNLRAKNLEKGIRQLIERPGDFYKHWRVAALHGKKLFGGTRPPSYIPSRVFALSLLDTFAPPEEGQDSHDLLARARTAVANEKVNRNIRGMLQDELDHVDGIVDESVNKRDELDYERYSVAARIDYRQYGVLLPSIGSGTDAESVTVRLIEALQQPVSIGNRQIAVTARAGLALFPQDGADAETLFENALAAMEDARSSQTDSYKFHSGTLKLRALQRNEAELELKTALDREQFSVDYLPIVDAKTGRAAGIEALLRWPKAIFGTQRTQKVVALAEHTGLIVPIGEWVMKKSIGDLKRWHEAGHTDLRLAINLSMQQFSRPDLPARLAAMLTAQGVGASYLDVEITEYMLYRDALAGYSAARALRDIGVGVVVDDFGTGACSIAHLSRSPMTAVKIDNSFVAVANQDAGRRACAAMIALAHELGRSVSAEGVETATQATVLREHGCDFLQGFLFLRPSAAAEIAAFLASRAGS